MLSTLRFNIITPGLDRQQLRDRHQAMIDMVGYADEHGISGASLEEHHGAENGWSPSPLILAALIFGRTKRLTVSLSALLVPLHDPLRVAEDIAVLDHASGGRFTVIGGIGYRPEEYVAHGKDWAKRGQLMDDAVRAMLAAWSGEPFEHNGAMIRVTPPPFTQPHPTFLLGGTSRIAVRRAARFGLMFMAAAHSPDLEPYYYEQCEKHGTTGFFMAASPNTSMVHIAEDPDRVWAQHGHCFLHEASVYANWQTPDIRSAVHSHATTVEELRAEGIYRVITPEACVAEATAAGAAAHTVLHPLCGGMPIDEAWSSVRLFAEEVLPALGAAS
jgi:alkanesulfonate monooxygenase SsuD/methylene tetrahydromethanopterin reductase-like flavin-dependent oxidoreductase (luciferase family)